ncbi:hypothetical protein F4781DRAFT_79015 [Annulohypoxylon bovei var. microspora]|nr:hypothetical protein F4781DRAFT_79015 [Annulohypoxylon bovei var. microspora]
MPPQRRSAGPFWDVSLLCSAAWVFVGRKTRRRLLVVVVVPGRLLWSRRFQSGARRGSTNHLQCRWDVLASGLGNSNSGRGGARRYCYLPTYIPTYTYTCRTRRSREIARQTTRTYSRNLGYPSVRVMVPGAGWAWVPPLRYLPRGTYCASSSSKEVEIEEEAKEY